MSRKRSNKKREFLGKINPNLVRTRVCLSNKPVSHKDKKKLQKKYWGRKKPKFEE